MKYSDVSQYKPMGSSPYERYYEKIARIQTRGDSKDIRGKVVSISDHHLTLEHLDGRQTLIRLSEIAVISEIPTREA